MSGRVERIDHQAKVDFLIYFLILFIKQGRAARSIGIPSGFAFLDAGNFAYEPDLQVQSSAQ
jgi:hypothetical protein